MEGSDKSEEQKDSQEEDMELCAAPVRPKSADVKVIVESFTERFFSNEIEGIKTESSSKTEQECSQKTKPEETMESKGDICTIKPGLVSEKIQSFSESFQTSLKFNERVDSSNDTCQLDIDNKVSIETTGNEDDNSSETSVSVEKEEDNKPENDDNLPNKIEEHTSSDETPGEIPLALKADEAVSCRNNEINESSSKGSDEETVSDNKESKENCISSNEPQAESNKVPHTEVKSSENSLYPNVVVKEENGKNIETIECKEIKKEVRIMEPSDSRKSSSAFVELAGSRKSSSGYVELSDSRKSSSAFVAERDITSIMEDASAILSQVAEPRFHAEPGDLRVAVVGAGPAGLCAARHLVTRGFRAEVYEQCADIGGTWVYSEEPTSGGHHLFPLHSSLYHDLWTNLPKEAMQFPDFDYPDDGTSYLPSEKILQYLVTYADHFNLHPIIKVKHQVKRVAPVGKGWGVTVEDLTTKTEDVSYFDAVMVCSGPNNIPVYPSIDGIAKFSGKQIHSRDYRRAETYSGKRVLIVGLGPSGLDITYQLAKTAKQVYLSHNKTKTPDIAFPEEVAIKPKVSSLFDKTVTFTDGTTEDVDVVIYCTGYTYNFPFLTEDCGIIVDQHVGPLYKHLINIERPTMCIVGLPKYCPHQYMVDYQVRSYLNILLGESKIPTKDEMLADLESDKILRNSEGQRKKDYHKLGKGRTKEYMDDLAELGDLEPVEPVMFTLFHDAFVRAIRDFKSFRNYVYKIVDKENYEIHLLDEKKS